MILRNRRAKVLALALALVMSITGIMATPNSAETSTTSKLSLGTLKIFKGDVINSLEFTVHHEYFNEKTWQSGHEIQLQGGTAGSISVAHNPADRNVVITLSNLQLEPNAEQLVLSNVFINTNEPGNNAVAYQGDLILNLEQYDLNVNLINVPIITEEIVRDHITVTHNSNKVNVPMEVNQDQLMASGDREITVNIPLTLVKTENKIDTMGGLGKIYNSPLTVTKKVKVKVHSDVYWVDDAQDPLPPLAPGYGRIIVSPGPNAKVKLDLFNELPGSKLETRNQLIIDALPNTTLADAMIALDKNPDTSTEVQCISDIKATRFESYKFSGFNDGETDYPKLPAEAVTFVADQTIVFTGKFDHNVTPIVSKKHKDNSGQLVEDDAPANKAEWALIKFKVAEGLEATQTFANEDIKLGVADSPYGQEVEYWVRKDKKIKAEALNTWVVKAAAGSKVQFGKWEPVINDAIILDKDMTFTAQIKKHEVGYGRSYYDLHPYPRNRLAKTHVKELPIPTTGLNNSQKDRVPNTGAAMTF